VFTRFVTYACPSAIEAGGCSLFAPLGTTQLTAGSLPAATASLKPVSGWMFPSSPSWRTVSNHGNGFQMPGVPALCCCSVQTSFPFQQSGSVPSAT